MIKVRTTTSTAEHLLQKLNTIEPDCWIDLSSPTQAEIDHVVDMTGVDRDLITKMLDENELPRIEPSGDSILIVIDEPAIDDEHEYITYPLGVIVAKNHIITVTTHHSIVLDYFRNERVKDFRSAKKTRMLIQILNITAAEYLKVLGNIYREIEAKEDSLKQSTRNEDLIDLLATEKALVYFTTSLKENDLVLERLTKGGVVQIYEEDKDLLEDATIEMRQAIDMSGIYHSILSSITNTYGTVISNNLNYAMKFLAGATIVLSVPTIISSFLGMNVPFTLLGTDTNAANYVFVGSIVISIITAIWLRKRGLL